jgi:small subunit ribosomal protein S30e
MGKVHGSLARAGKVKGQTPKVPKAEKSKKLSGRSRRRQLYNRRFVNVVPGAKKQGPNKQEDKRNAPLIAPKPEN